MRAPGEEPARRVLDGRPLAGASAPGRAVAVGLMMAAGGLMALALFSFAPEGALPTEIMAPMRAVIAVSCACAATAGLLALRDMRRRSRAAEAARRDPANAWRLDWPSSSGLVSDHAAVGALESLGGSLLALVPGASLLCMFAVGAAFGDGRQVAFALVFGLGFVALGVYGVRWRLVTQYLRFGGSALTTEPFPLRLGRPARAALAARGRLSRPRAELRFVVEVRVERGSGRTADAWIERREKAVLPARVLGAAAAPGGRTRVDVEFDLPSSGLPTKLAQDPPEYWELSVSDEAAGYAATFVLPVYPA
jgi:hypothetical protein